MDRFTFGRVLTEDNVPKQFYWMIFALKMYNITSDILDYNYNLKEILMK